MSLNWFVAATLMGFSTEQRTAETTGSTRITAGLILGSTCLASVLTGVIYAETLSMLQTIPQVQVDSLR